MNHKISFNSAQVQYLMEKLGADDPHEAVETFAKIIRELSIDPRKMHEYLEVLMKNDGV
jgi:uncharacterized protein YbcC (UPF0753/DUF2309 family)